MSTASPLLPRLMTSNYLIQRYLLDLDQFDPNMQLTGVPTGQNGQAFPEVMYTQQVKTSFARAEKEFDLVLRELRTVPDERHSDIDFGSAQFVSFTMDRRPVRELLSVEMRIGNFAPSTLPLSWFEIVNGDLGQVRLMPSQAAWSVGITGPWNLPWLFQLRYNPGIFVFTYRAGFDGIADLPATYALGTFTRPALVGSIAVQPSTSPAAAQSFTATFTGTNSTGTTISETLTWTAGESDEQVTDLVFYTVTSAVFAATAGTPSFTVTSQPVYPLDEDIQDVIGNWATFGISDIAGDLLGGSGIASYSRGQDGLSTNVNTTSSPENHGFSAKQKQQRLRIKELTEAIKRRYSMAGVASL